MFHSPKRTRMPEVAVLSIETTRYQRSRLRRYYVQGKEKLGPVSIGIDSEKQVRMLGLPVHAMSGCDHPSIVDKSSATGNPSRQITCLDDGRLLIQIIPKNFKLPAT